MLEIMDLGYNLINVEKHIKLFLKKELNRLNLTATEGLVLLLLFRQEDGVKAGKITGEAALSQERIMQDLHYDKGVITRVMQSLERQDYVSRLPNPADGRSWLFVLSQKAFFIKEELFIILKRWQEELFKGLSPDEINLLSKLIHQISDNSWKFYGSLD